ncbi:MAG: putative Ig domain-containing protein [Syntrophobacterales bacterium]|jgi:hypothetical protein
MKKKNLFALAIVIAITIGSFGILSAAEPNIVPNDPLVTSFMQSDVWWALKSQRDMAIDERISNVMNLGTHNSFNASAEGFRRSVAWIGVDTIGVQPNQLFTIVDQLRMGVRLIELDVYDMDIDNDGSTELVLRHNETYGTTVKGFDGVLSSIRSWLSAPENGQEIIFLDIEDHASGDPRLLEYILAYFGDTIFTPVDRGDLFEGRWPTRNELLDLGKRVIIFTHGDFSDGPIRLFEAYSEEDQKLHKWFGSDHFFSMGIGAYPELNPYTNMTDKTINDYWDGNNLPPYYQQDLEKFFVVRSDGLAAGPRAMVGWDAAYCALNNVNFIKMDFALGQEYDIEDWSGTSRNDYDTPGGLDNDFEKYSFLDNFRGNRLSRAIWSWQIDTYRHDPNIYLLSYQELHSPTARVANRTDGRHYVIQEGFYTVPSQLILSQDWVGVAPDPTEPYFRTTRGHWNTQQKENVHPFACAKVGSNGTEWRITQQEGYWDEGAQICDQEFNNQGQGTWAFAGPVNGWQNFLLLMTRWNYAYSEGRTTVATAPVWINVSDEDNNSDWTVRASGPPSIQDVQVEPTALQTGQTVNVDGKFTDLESVEHTVTVDWGDGNTDKMDFAPGKSGSFSFAHPYAAEGSYVLTLEVTDNVFTAKYVHPTPIVVTEACQPPVLEPIGDKTVKENELLEFTLTATDPDGDIAYYEVTQGLPDGAEFDPDTQTFSWIPDYAQAGEHVVYFAVYDLCNPDALSDYEEITITVENMNRAPVLEPIGDKTGKVDELLEFTIEATDPDDDLITYSAKMLTADETEELPAGATLNPVTGEFSWTPDYTQAGSYQISFSVSDGNLTAEEVIVITTSELSPSEWMTRILAFFDESVEAGTLEGVGHRSWLAKCRLRFMRIVLNLAKRFIERDRTKAACHMLKRAYKRCDSERRPSDFVCGEATAELASMIQAAMESMGCKMKH